MSLADIALLIGLPVGLFVAGLALMYALVRLTER